MLTLFECRLSELLRNSKVLLFSFMFNDEDTDDNSA
jgi:hypothetical protein